MEEILNRPELIERLAVDSLIADYLRKMNSDVLDEPLPDRFVELLKAHRKMHANTSDDS